MPLKNRVWLIIILLFAMLTVAIFLIMQQIDLLFKIVSIYWIACAISWGIFFIIIALKYSKQENKLLRSNQSIFVVIGLGVALPSALNTRLWGNEGQIGHTSWPVINQVEIVAVSLFLIILLFFEVLLTVSLIRSFLKVRISSSQTTEKTSSE